MSSQPGRVKMEIERSSGNVFEDLGLPESDLLLAKSELVIRIGAIMEGRGLTQVTAAKLMSVSQADVSGLLSGNLRGFSTDRLLRFLSALGQDVEIVIPKRLNLRRAGHLRVVHRGVVGGATSTKPRRKALR